MENNLLYLVKSIWQMLIFAVITAGLELLGMGLFMLCGICDAELLHNSGQISCLVLILSQMLAVAVIQIIFYSWKRWENHDAVWKNRVGFFCVCAGCFVGMLLMDVSFLNLNELSVGQIIVLGLLTVLNFLGYIFYFISAEKSRLETESRVYQKQAVLYQEWYEGFQKTRKETLAFRHDMNNHFGVLKHLCKNGEDKESGGVLTEIGKYIDSMGTNYNRTGCDTDSGNLMMDFAVDMKKNYAQSRGIPMEVELNIPKEMNYNSMDLVIFLSNLLDNAIEACERMEQKEKAKIVLKLQYKMSNLVVLIKNTYDGQLDGQSSDLQEYAMLETSKDDKAAHGIGMKNVMDIVEKYHGAIRWKAEQGWFTVNALLYEFEDKKMRD
ncbi:MAG: GHKL domain-containing protein [Lachnospiraceae bacterium]|nr:GHKL domain-containing protein [Lachnospiraceae bacterium]